MPRCKINKGFIVQKLDDKTVIFDGEESVLYTFNETASFIFSKLKLGWEKREILKALMKRYGIKENKAQSDLKDFLEDLIKKNILT
jgi:phage gp16-like protein